MDWRNWETVTDWVEQWRSDDGETAERSGAESLFDERSEPESLFDPLAYDPEALVTRADISTELGLVPAEFVRRIIEVEGGKIRQQEFSKYGNFSDSTVCRMLQELESQGDIKRFRFGREKVVIHGERTVPALESSGTATGAELAGGVVKGRTQNGEVPESW